MADTAAPTLTLESLLVEIAISGIKQLQAAQKEVAAAVDGIAAKMKELGSMASAAAEGIAALALATTALGNAVPLLESSAAIASVSALATGLANIGQANLSGSVAQLTNVLKGLATAPLEEIGKKMAGVATALMDKRFYSDNFGKVVVNLRDLGAAFASISQGISGLSSIHLAAIGDAVQQMGVSLLGASLHFKRAATAAVNLNALGDSLRNISGVDASLITSAGTAISGAMKSIGEGLAQAKLHYVAITRSLPNLQALITTMGILGKVSIDPTKFTAIRDALGNLFGGDTLRNLLVGSKLDKVFPTRVIQNLYRLAASLKMLSNLKDLPNVQDILTTMFGGKDMANILSQSGLGGDAITVVVNNLRKLALSLAGLARLDAGAFTKNMAGFGPGLKSLSDALVNVNLPDVANVAFTLGKLLAALRGMGKMQFAWMQPMAQAISNFANTIGSISVVNVAPVAVQIGRLASALIRFGRFDPSWIGTNRIAKPVMDMFVGLAAAPVTVAANTITQLGRLATMLMRFGSVDPTKLTDLRIPLVGLFTALEGIGTTQLPAAADAIQQLGKLTNALRRLWAVDLNMLPKVGIALQGFFTQLNSIVVTPNATAVAGIFSRIGTAAKNLVNYYNLAGAAGPIPPVVANVTNSINNLPPAMGRASAASVTLRQRFRDLLPTIATLGGAFNTFRLSMLGAVAYGTYLFAKLDDSITRVLAHMREWTDKATHPGTRATLEQGVQNLAMSSRIGMTDLTEGLDLFASQGMSAAMAVRAMGVAESFAVASHMKMGEATKELIRLQNTLGMSSGDVETHFKNMTQLGDLFVGMAPMVGSSTKELTEAMGSKFVGIMQLTKMELKDAIALLGVYSERGVRGSHASDMASMALRQTAILAERNAEEWDAMGIKVYGAGMKMLGIGDILQNLQNHLAGMETLPATGRLLKLGFEPRTLNAILQLVGMGDEFARLRKEVDLTHGVMDKMADMLRGSFLAVISRLAHQAMVVATAIGNTLAPALSHLADGIGTLFKSFMGLNPAMRSLIIGAGLLYVLFVPMLSIILMVGKFLVGPFILAGKAIAFMWSMASLAFSAMWTGIKGIGTLVYWLGRAFGTTMRIVEWSITKVTKLVGDLATTIIKGVFQLMVSGLIGLVSFFINLVGFILLVPVALGAIVTVATTIGAVFAVVMSVVKQLWDSVKQGAIQTGQYVAANARNIKNSLVGVWVDFRKTFDNISVDLGVRMGIVAGFFWNFRANVKIILDWLKEHWAAAFHDVVLVTMTILENLATNIETLLQTIMDIGGKLFRMLWVSFAIYASVPFTWIRDQWGNILADMTMMFQAFIKALVWNIGTIAGKWREIISLPSTLRGIDDDIASRVSDIKRVIAHRELVLGRQKKWGQTEEAKVTEEFIAAKRKEIDELRASAALQKEWALMRIISPRGNELKSPADYMQPFQTSAAGLTTGFGMATAGLQLGWEKVWNAIPAIWKEGVDDFVELLPKEIIETLKAPWAGLNKAILTGLPPDIIKGILKWLKGPIGAIPEGDGELTPVSGKQGPGYAFKQISEARYMIGGPMAEALDYQQLKALQGINKNTADTAAAMGELLNRPRGRDFPLSVLPE